MGEIRWSSHYDLSTSFWTYLVHSSLPTTTSRSRIGTEKERRKTLHHRLLFRFVCKDRASGCYVGRRGADLERGGTLRVSQVGSTWSAGKAGRTGSCVSLTTIERGRETWHRPKGKKYDPLFCYHLSKQVPTIRD